MSAASATVIEYSYDDEFPSKIQRLMSNGQAFVVEVHGEFLRLLQPHLDGGRIRDVAKLALVPKLRTIVGIMTFGLGKDVPVKMDVEMDVVRIWYGAGGDA